MSVRVSSWVWHSRECEELSGNELVLLVALADVADDQGRCRYVSDEDDLTYDGLARKVRVSRRTVERLVPALVERGLLEHRFDVGAEARHFVAGGGPVALAVAPQVHRDAPQARLGERVPPLEVDPVALRVRGEAVDEQHRRAVRVAELVQGDPRPVRGHREDGHAAPPGARQGASRPS